MQKLITIKFEVDPATEEQRRTCPSCRKVLSNASAPVLIPPKQEQSENDGIITCFVCDEPVAIDSSPEGGHRSHLPTGLVALRSEGTGFSAKGSSTVEKSGVAFQC
jgi:nitric oxide synthase-interacting protein